jgi:hypothetical protein
MSELSRGPYRSTSLPKRRAALEPIYTAGTLQEAQLLLDRLLEAGIEARLMNEHLLGGFGQLPYGESLPRIALTNAAQAEDAAAVIAAFETRMRQTDDAVLTCPSCSEENPENFELCWNCGDEL